MTEKQISRRTVTKGAAWAVPLTAVATAAPAFAASAGDSYKVVASWHTRQEHNGGQCSTQYGSGGYLSSLRFTLDYSANGSSPRGFGVVNEPNTNTGRLSPSTTVTDLQFSITVAYPAGMVTRDANGVYFYFDQSTSNWTNATYLGRTTIDGRYFDQFQFTWLGTKTGTSKDPSPTATFAEATKQLTGNWVVNGNYCVTSAPYYYVRPSWSFTAAGKRYTRPTTNWIHTPMPNP